MSDRLPRPATPRLTAIARVELLDAWRDGRFRWSAMAVLALLAFAVVSGGAQQRQIAHERATAQGAMRQQWLDQGAKNPHSAAHFGIYAFRHPPALALFDRGVEPYTGSSIWLEAHYQNPAAYAPARDATALARFGELSAAATLQLVVPLLLVALGAGTFAGERERGLLALVAGTGVTPRRLALGKALGLAGAVAVPLVPAAALGALALTAAEGAGSIARTTGLAAAYLGYFAVFLALALAVSARARSARAALLALLAFWAVNALVVPRAVRGVAEGLYPTPSWHAFHAAVDREKREGIDGHNPIGRRAEELERRLLAEHGVSSVEELPVDFGGVALQADEDHANRVYDRHFGALWATYGRQHRVHTLAALLAPAIAVRDISMGLAGSDGWHQRHFAHAAERYRRDLVRRLNDEIIYGSHGRAYEENLAGRELWERIPDFRYRMPGASWALRHQRGAFAVLALWLALAGGAAALAVGRYRLGAA